MHFLPMALGAMCAGCGFAPRFFSSGLTKVGFADHGERHELFRGAG